MKNNIILKLLASLPIIFLSLYFIPFLGICLILFRFFMYSDKKRISTLIIIIGVGILVLIPRCLYLLLDILKVDINTIPYLNDIIKSELYGIDFMNYSKLLICVGIILLIVLFILKNIFDTLGNRLKSTMLDYINKTEKRNAEISKQNDLEIKIKQEKAKNTNYVKCPNCGSDNLLSEKFGTCKYCRRSIKNEKYKV